MAIPISFSPALEAALVAWLKSQTSTTNAALTRIEAALAALTAQGVKVMAAIDDLEAKVSDETTVEQSAITLLNNLGTMIKAAGTDPARLNALTALIDQRKGALAAAVAANTPAAAAQP